MKIALISLDQKWEDKDANLQRCQLLLRNAVICGADLAIFPEMTLTGFTFNLAASAEDANSSPTIQCFAALAKEHRLAIVAGVVIRTGDAVTNELVAFDSHGLEQARYAKIHPFSFAGEDRLFRSGDRLARMRLGQFTLGFSICYDLRFQEIYTALARDCDVLVNIANWPQRRVNHWRTLLQARAIENQTYVVGVNHVGSDGNGLAQEASSMVVNANGEIVAPVSSERELDIIEIHEADLANFRNGLSTRPDRKPDLYRTLI
jgi:predicted amidohydrolase